MTRVWPAYSRLTDDDDTVRRALAQRLRAAATLLLPAGPPPPDPDPGRDASGLLDLLVRQVHDELTPDAAWLLSVALSGAYPDPEHVTEVLRSFELASVVDSTLWLLDACTSRAMESSCIGREMRVVTGGVVVEVDQAAREDTHTGIQEVVRRTMPLWDHSHDLVLAAWTRNGGALRELTAIERSRVLAWSGSPRLTGHTPSDPDPPDLPILVPWRSVVVLPDVAAPYALSPLMALARYSNNALVTIGHDCIPAISADMVPVGGANRFIRYLSTVKYMRRVAAVSASSAVEFQGYVDALPTQGLSGPVVVECRLPSEHRPVSDPASPATARPTVVVVGSFEPRKNHLTLLHAAETLWREGHAFQLLLIGGMTWGTEVPKRVRQLQKAGRPVTTRHSVTQTELDHAYRTARFTVFASLHEGYGLPVAESLAAGVPAITANFGSTAQIAAAGGALTIDPRDDEELTNAMRVLLTDDVRLAELRAQIVARPARTWEDYAEELWTCSVAPELAAVAQARTP
jgi:glycosyltransferase involved in cell wall biosynthesis